MRAPRTQDACAPLPVLTPRVSENGGVDYNRESLI